jgi:hypothetical protein
MRTGEIREDQSGDQIRGEWRRAESRRNQLSQELEEET